MLLLIGPWFSPNGKLLLAKITCSGRKTYLVKRGCLISTAPSRSICGMVDAGGQFWQMVSCLRLSNLKKKIEDFTKTNYLPSWSVETNLKFMGPTPLDVNATTDTLYRWNFFRLVKVWIKFSVVVVSCTEALLGSVKVTWYPRIMPSWQHLGTLFQEARSFVEPWWTTLKLSGGLDGSENVKCKCMVGEWEGRRMDEMKVKEIALNPCPGFHSHRSPPHGAPISHTSAWRQPFPE